MTDDDERDYVQEHKDGVAMGYINEDGTPRDPDEPDWAAIAWQEHLDDEHDGGPCNCPQREPLPEPPGGYDDEPPF